MTVEEFRRLDEAFAAAKVKGMPERPERCETCRFWAPPGECEGEDGDCHRYPPSPALHVGDLGNNRGLYAVELRPSNGGYPQVNRRDWCGEWAPAGTVA